MADLEALKKRAALAAVKHVESGMLVGLGTGSTAKYAIQALGAALSDGRLSRIIAVVTSEASGALATSLEIPLVELTGQTLDLAIDGMDELDPDLNAVKGLGGALTREKIVESCATTLILVGDETKRVAYLGEHTPIPVEVVVFGWQATVKHLEALGCRPTRREQAGQAYVTDNGNYILDCYIDRPDDVYALAAALSAVPGVVEHGLFLDMAALAYIATTNEVLRLEKPTLKFNPPNPDPSGTAA
ncbi:ribose 5-phosphate isomerase A [soil metagenome]